MRTFRAAQVFVLNILPKLRSKYLSNDYFIHQTQKREFKVASWINKAKSSSFDRWLNTFFWVNIKPWYKYFNFEHKQKQNKKAFFLSLFDSYKHDKLSPSKNSRQMYFIFTTIKNKRPTFFTFVYDNFKIFPHERD